MHHHSMKAMTIDVICRFHWMINRCVKKFCKNSCNSQWIVNELLLISYTVQHKARNHIHDSCYSDVSWHWSQNKIAVSDKFLWKSIIRKVCLIFSAFQFISCSKADIQLFWVLKHDALYTKNLLKIWSAFNLKINLHKIGFQNIFAILNSSWTYQIPPPLFIFRQYEYASIK